MPCVHVTWVLTANGRQVEWGMGHWSTLMVQLVLVWWWTTCWILREPHPSSAWFCLRSTNTRPYSACACLLAPPCGHNRHNKCPRVSHGNVLMMQFWHFLVKFTRNMHIYLHFYCFWIFKWIFLVQKMIWLNGFFSKAWKNSNLSCIMSVWCYRANYNILAESL